DERLTWAGKHWRFDGVDVLPKPLQQPHPPTWLAAGSEGAVRWAAQHGHAIMLGPHSTFAENAAHHDLYLAERAAAGHPPPVQDLPMARMVAVAATDADAERVARAGVSWVAGAYINASKVTRPGTADQSFMTMDRSALIQRYLDSVVIHGSV